MKASILKIFIVGLLWPQGSFSQQFWSLTQEFWGGPKTGIILVDDSVLLVGTKAGVLKSIDEGNHLEWSLSASSVHTIFVSSAGKVFAGGTGKIYISEDKGISWDSVFLNANFPVRQFAENKNGSLFAITGSYNQGDGVFYSGNDGLTWEPRNQGLGVLKGCERITTDKNGRLYLAISDESSSGSGGLFVSENNGLTWDKISVKPDSYRNAVKITNTTGLSVSAADSLYLSFYGVASGVLIHLNIAKSINDIKSDSPWSIFQVHTNSSWWMDRPLNNIHFSQKGDWYSSFTETVNQGATYFMEAGGHNWSRIDYGLGSSEDGWRQSQYFAENKAGKIFMIQYLDERIYQTDKSLITSVKIPVQNSGPIRVFPNPVKAGGKVIVRLPHTENPVEITVCDLNGTIHLSVSASAILTEIKAPEMPGLYILSVRYMDGIKSCKILVC